MALRPILKYPDPRLRQVCKPVADPSTELNETDVSILRTEVPFGPFLAAGAIASAFYGADIISWYLGLIRL